MLLCEARAARCYSAKQRVGFAAKHERARRERRCLFLAVGVLVSLAGVVSSVEGETWKFDFGRKDRPQVMAGFTAVTVHDTYDPERGYGWVGATGEVKADWLEERLAQAGCLRSRSVDDLSADYVSGGMPFALDVANGKYVVWLMVGDWGAYEFYPRGKYTVLVEDAVIGELDHSTYEKFKGDFWRHRDEPFIHGEDLFEKYVESRFLTYRATAEVRDGRLDVQVRADAGPGKYVGPLNALVVFPEVESEAGEEELRKIREARRAQFEKKYTVLDVSRYYVGDTKKEENGRGFAAWTVPYSDELGVGDRFPRNRETERLSALVSLGEMEPVVVCVRPLTKDPGRFTCTVGPLVGEEGDRLPASALSVRVAKPWEMIGRPSPEMIEEQAKKDVKLNRYSNVIYPRPYFLVERNWFEGQERINRHFWLTVKVPEDAQSTTYTTDVTVTGPKSKHVMPLTVTVVPVELDRARQALALNYSAPSYPGWFEDLKAENHFWTMVERDLQLMYDYGMTTVGLLGGFRLPRPEQPEEENRWEKFIRLYQKVGFERELCQGGTMGLYRQMPQELGSPREEAWQDAYVKVFRDYEAVAKRLGQNVVYSIGDETTNDGGEGLILTVGQVAKERMPDVSLISDINGYRELMALAPLIDAVGFNNGWTGNYVTNRPGHQLMTRDVIERVRSLGATPWFINGGKGRYPFGIWFWKTTKWGQYGKIEWHYDASSADLYNPLDGTSNNDFGSLVLPHQVCTIQFELCREGIDDLRYLQYLEKLVVENADSTDTFAQGVARRARDALNYYNDSVADRFRGASTPDGSGEYSGDAWPADRLAEVRREIAMLICMFKGKVVPGVYDDFALVDGDTGYRPDRQLGGRVTTWVTEHATQGEHCFKLTFEGGKGYADKWGRPPTKDWRGYRKLKLDVVNPQSHEATLLLQLRDQVASNLGAYELRHIAPLACKPGRNSFELDLVGMKASGADYDFDMSCLFSFFFTVEGDRDVTLYLDNMRLSPK